MIDAVATIEAILVLLIGIPLNWYVLVRLRTLYRERPNPVLRDRATTELFILSAALVFGVIFLFNDGVLPIPFLDSDGTKIMTRTIMLALVTIPAIRWINLYKGRM